MVTKKRTKKPHPKAVHWGVNLRAWLSANLDARKREQDNGLPSTIRGLARAIRVRGEECTAGATQDWHDGASLPGGRYIEILENLMGRPWRELTAPIAPKKVTAKTLSDLAALLPEPELRILVERVRSELAAPPRTPRR